MRSFDRRTLFQAATILIALVAAWPLFAQPGLLNTRGGGDSPFLLQRLHQLVVALGDGHFPVRWMADANYGFGYPFFNFYAPLSIYIGALFRFLGYSYVQAIKLAQLAGFLLAAWTMFHLARRWVGSSAAGFLAAAAYTLAPFHMVNVYVRGDSLAEFWAMALYPVTLLSADELARRPGPRSGLLLGLSFAALILCHNISALIFTPFLLLFIGIVVRRGRTGSRQLQRNVLLYALAGLALGLALSAWFWLPALAETGLAQTEPVTTGYFSFENHFLTSPIQDSWSFSYEVAGREAFRMGLVQLLLALPGLAAAGYLLIRTARRKEPASRTLPHAGGASLAAVFFVVVLFLGASLMVSVLSAPLWRTLPLLPYVQFPWRFLSAQAVATSLLIGCLAWFPGRRLIVPLCLIGLLWSALSNLRTEFLPVTDDDVTAAALAQYEWFSGNIGSTVSAEYLPHTVTPRPFTSLWLEQGTRQAARFLVGAGEAVPIEFHTQRQAWQLAVETDSADLVLPTMYWPGWRATLDGEPIALQAAPGSGLLMVSDLPNGRHTLALTLGRTPVRLLAELLAIPALLAAALLGVSVWRRNWHRVVILLMLCLGASLALSAAAKIRREPDYQPGTRNWDFAQMPYLHHAPEGIVFADAAGDMRLLRYEYSSSELISGSELSVTLIWASPEAASETPVTLSLASPAIHRFPYAPLLATTTGSPAGVEQELLLTIPENAPAGLYLPRLTVAGARALTPTGQPRGALFLEPIRIVADGQSAAFDRELELTVRSVVVEGEPPIQLAEGATPETTLPCDFTGGQLTLQLAWYTAQPLTENYNVSLRLQDAAGHELMLCDGQPGHGFRPGSLWPAGELVEDWLGMPLPPTLPADAPYVLSARLYDVATGRPLLSRRLGQLVWQAGGSLAFQQHAPVFSLPPNITPTEAVFGEQIGLHGYELETGDDALAINLVWQALAAMPEDYLRFVHLLDPETGVIVTQADGMPQNESYPTSQWVVGEVVTDRVMLNMDGVPPGVYEVVVGFYRNAPDFPRLSAYDALSGRLPDDRFVLVATLPWP